MFQNEENTQQIKVNYYNGYFTRSGRRNQCYEKEKPMNTKMNSEKR